VVLVHRAWAAVRLGGCTPGEMQISSKHAPCGHRMRLLRVSGSAMLCKLRLALGPGRRFAKRSGS